MAMTRRRTACKRRRRPGVLVEELDEAAAAVDQRARARDRRAPRSAAVRVTEATLCHETGAFTPAAASSGSRRAAVSCTAEDRDGHGEDGQQRHEGIFCDGCAPSAAGGYAQPIVGVRYTRRDADFDLCAECFRGLVVRERRCFDPVVHPEEAEEGEDEDEDEGESVGEDDGGSEDIDCSVVVATADGGAATGPHGEMAVTLAQATQAVRVPQVFSAKEVGQEPAWAHVVDSPITKVGLRAFRQGVFPGGGRASVKSHGKLFLFS